MQVPSILKKMFFINFFVFIIPILLNNNPLNIFIFLLVILLWITENSIASQDSSFPQPQTYQQINCRWNNSTYG